MLIKQHRTQKRPGKVKYIFILTFFLIAFSQPFAQYEMKKYTINSGGGDTMSGGSFTLKSSTGQVDASNTMAGGTFGLTGGFWQASAPTNTTELIFSNSFE